MKFKHVVNQVEDLKCASFQISELEKLAAKQVLWIPYHIFSVGIHFYI
jgi:hypothetical protein